MGGTAGTDRNATHYADLLCSGTSAVMVAGPGLGKSHLLRALDRELTARGLAPLRLQPEAAGTAPFQSLIDCLDARLDGLRAHPSLDIIEYLTAIEGGPGAPPPILLIDDADNLDAHSAESIQRLIRYRRISAMMMLSPTDANGDTKPADGFTSLWIEGLALRVELAPMTESAADELLTRIATGTSVSIAHRQRILSLAAGNPLWVTELTLDMLDAPNRPSVGHSLRLRHALTRLTGALTAAQSLVLAVAHLLGRLSSADAVRLCGTDQTLAMIRGGQLTRTELTDIVHVDDLLGLAAQLSVDPDDVLATVRELVVDGHQSLTEAPPEPLAPATLAAAWSTPAHLDAAVSATSGDGVAAVLVRASAAALASGDAPAAAWRARQSLAAAATVHGAVALSRALMAAGLRQEAGDVLLHAVDDRRSVADSRLLVLQSGRVGVRTGDAQTDPIARLWDDARRWHPDDTAFSRVLASVDMAAPGLLPEQIVGMAHDLAVDDLADPGIRVQAACVGAIMLAMAGRIEAAQTQIRTAREILRTAGSEHGRLEVLLVGVAVVVENCGGALPKTLVNELAADGATTGAAGPGRGDPPAHRPLLNLVPWFDHANHMADGRSVAIIGYAAGVQALQEGRLHDAEAELRTAEARFARTDIDPVHSMLISDLIRTLAMLGRPTDARALLSDAARITAPEDAGARQRLARATMAVTAAEGDAEQARRIGWELVSACAEHSPPVAVWTAHDLYRYADEHPQNLSGVMSQAAARTDSPLLDALAEGMRLRVSDDAAGLDAVAERLATLGAGAYASDAGHDAARLHAAAGDIGAATESRARVRRIGSPGPNRHNVTHHRSARFGESLTRREVEMARMAGEMGLSNILIAEALFVSVRTVETHLRRVYTKLGVHSRRDIATALGLRLPR